MTSTKEIGQRIEQLASRYLQDNGLVTITQNYLQRGGEIDLIMQEGDLLIFVEVRYRRNQQFGGALESVTRKKQQRIIQTAQLFLQQYQAPYSGCRFDVIAIEPSKNDFNINWVKDAFQLN